MVEAGQAHQVERVPRLSTTGSAVDAAHPQAVLDVLRHRHVREERIVLEHGVDVTAERRLPSYVGSVEHDAAGTGFLEAGDHAQHGGLTRSGRPEHREELAPGHLEIDAIDRNNRAERLTQAAQLDPRRVNTFALGFRSLSCRHANPPASFAGH